MSKYSALALLLASQFSYAENNSIEHISIYANRQAKPINQTLSSVTVLDRAEILARQVRDLPALLQQVAGVSVARDGGRGQSSSVFIRGGSSGHTLVLLDGVRIGSATLGYQSLAMVALDQIEKIEVIRGPKAALYGSDALGGVIAITSRRAAHTEYYAALGSHGLAETSLAGSGQLGDVSLFGSVGTAMANGYSAKINADPDADGFEQSYVKVGAELQASSGFWQWQSQLNSGYYEFDSSFGGDRADTAQDSHQLLWRGEWAASSQQLKLARSIDSDINYGDKAADSLFKTSRDEADYQAIWALQPSLNWLVGGNWYQEQVQKNAPNYSQDERTSRSLFSGLNYQWHSWLLDGVGRRDEVSGYGGQNTYHLAAGYQLNAEWTARASQGTSYKVPTFNALYWPQYGNPLLKPEQSLSREVGLDYQQPQWQVNAVLFKRDLTNLIQQIGQQSGQQLQNVLLATIRGAELTADWQAGDWQSGFNYTWLDGQDEKTKAPLVKRPAHKVSWHGSQQWQDWRVSLAALYQSRSYSGKDFSGKKLNDLGSYLVWNLGLSYQWQPNTLIRFKLDNLFDKQYQTNLGYQQAGLEFGLSVQVTAI